MYLTGLRCERRQAGFRWSADRRDRDDRVLGRSGCRNHVVLRTPRRRRATAAAVRSATRAPCDSAHKRRAGVGGGGGGSVFSHSRVVREA